MSATRMALGLAAIFVLAGAGDGWAQSEVSIDRKSAEKGTILIGPAVQQRSARLRIALPDGRFLEAKTGNRDLRIDLAGKGDALPDGTYRYEYFLVSELPAQKQTAGKKAGLNNGREEGARPRPFETTLLSGTFVVRDGHIDLDAGAIKERTNAKRQ